MSVPFKPTPFQRATIDAIVRLFKDKKNPQRRVLVADEVGLGKTIVARGVIEALEQIRREEGDDLFKVVYVCSSQNIVSQNLSKLAPDRRSALDEENPAEARLSMQHLLVAESDARRMERGDFLQLIPITPETSFRVAGRGGTWRERAILCAVIALMPEFSSHKTALSSRFCGSSGRAHWAGRLAEAINHVQKAREASGNKYPANVWKELRKRIQDPNNPDKTIPFNEFINRMLAKPAPRGKTTAFNDEIGILRAASRKSAQGCCIRTS